MRLYMLRPCVDVYVLVRSAAKGHQKDSMSIPSLARRQPRQHLPAASRPPPLAASRPPLLAPSRPPPLAPSRPPPLAPSRPPPLAPSLHWVVFDHLSRWAVFDHLSRWADPRLNVAIV